MIWAKMPLKKKELNTIEESHKIRPYLVAEKSKYKLICYKSSSKLYNKLNNYEKYCISKIKYDKSKNSYIDLRKTVEIPICNIMSKYIKVLNVDLKNIEKRLEIEKNKNVKDIVPFKIKFNIEEGDVVLNKNIKYYIYATDNINLYGIRLYKKKSNSENIVSAKINKQIYYLNFEEREILKKSEEIKILDIANIKEIEMMKELKKEQKRKEKLEKNNENTKGRDYVIGSVLKIKNSKIVYLFNEKGRYYGIDIDMYIIKPKILEIRNIEKYKILKTITTTQYIKILEFLVQCKIKQIKMIRKLYKENRQSLFKIS